MLNQNDYLVRVDMNDLLLRLDIDNKQHREFANLLLDQLFHMMNDEILFEFTYTSTIEHRLKVKWTLKYNVYIFFFLIVIALVACMLFNSSYH